MAEQGGGIKRAISLDSICQQSPTFQAWWPSGRRGGDSSLQVAGGHAQLYLYEQHAWCPPLTQKELHVRGQVATPQQGKLHTHALDHHLQGSEQIAVWG